MTLIIWGYFLMKYKDPIVWLDGAMQSTPVSRPPLGRKVPTWSNLGNGDIQSVTNYLVYFELNRYK